MPASSVVRSKSDADILADLQGLGCTANINAYSSLIGQVLTWATAPSAGDKNAVLAYFQQGNHLESV